MDTTRLTNFKYTENEGEYKDIIELEPGLSNEDILDFIVLHYGCNREVTYGNHIRFGDKIFFYPNFLKLMIEIGVPTENITKNYYADEIENRILLIPEKEEKEEQKQENFQRLRRILSSDNLWTDLMQEVQTSKYLCNCCSEKALDIKNDFSLFKKETKSNKTLQHYLNICSPPLQNTVAPS